MINKWDYKKIGDILLVERGGSPRPIKKYITDSENGVNWIKIGDASNDSRYITRTKEKITQDGVKKSRMVYEGDFILSNSMSFGKPYIMKTSGCIHDGWLVLRKKENEETLNNDFLYHLLGSPNIFKQFNELASGSTVRNLNIRLVSSVKIPVPPLPEQKQIVETLNKAFEKIDKAIANVERNIVNAKELFESYLQNTFENKGDNWEEKTLGEVVVINTGKLNSNAMEEDGKYPFFTCSRKIFAINEYAFDCKAVLLAGNNASGDFNVKYYEGKFNAYQRTYVITVNSEKELLYSYLKHKLLFHLSVFK